MIQIIRHKGLRALYVKGDGRGVDARWIKRLRLILARLDASAEPLDMNLPGLRLHALKGDRQGFYAVDVSGNWRVVFRFEGAHATDVDLIDYH
jgi:toxin HigB-1